MGDITLTDVNKIDNEAADGLNGVEGSLAYRIAKVEDSLPEVLSVEAIITGNGAIVANIFKFTGTIRIVNQEAEITEITDITTCSNVYATVYDGTNTVDLTADGIDLSGSPVGSWFTRDKVSAETYSLNVADQVRLNETIAGDDAGLAFNLTAKNGVDNFIQFRFTGDANTNFKLNVVFKYILFNGATLELV
jgi:hypothetical protein